MFSEAELTKLLTQTGHIDRQLQSKLEGHSAATDSFEGSLKSKEAQHPLINTEGDGDPHSSTTPQQASQRFPHHQRTLINEDQPPLDDSVPFAADDDFEWDERETLWTTHEQITGKETMRDTDDGSLRKITDGMATLTANASNTGFLGTVSGAALLRQISANQYERESSDGPSEMGEERRSSIIDSLSSQLHENLTPMGSWLRAKPIMTRAYVDTLIDLYFAYYHPTFPILHEATFRHQYQNLNERPKGVLHTLASLVAALGSFVSTNASDETDIYLFNGVKSQLTVDSLETGSLNLVQSFAMAANYLQKRNRPNSGYNYGGVALRLAISLGLHKEFRNWHAAPLKKEIRRRVWWSLCILDVGATITYGRPLNWPQAGVEAHFPLNIHERVSTSGHLSRDPRQ